MEPTYSQVISDYLDRDHQFSLHKIIISEVNNRKDLACKRFSEGLFLISYFTVQHKTVLFTYLVGLEKLISYLVMNHLKVEKRSLNYTYFYFSFFLCSLYFTHFCQRLCFASFSINLVFPSKRNEAIKIMVDKTNLFLDKKKSLLSLPW